MAVLLAAPLMAVMAIPAAASVSGGGSPTDALVASQPPPPQPPPPQVPATTATLPATADGYADPSRPGTPSGSSPVLMAGDEGLDGRVTYLKFTLPPLPADATDVTATLSLAQVGLSGPASSTGTWPVVRVYSTSTGWAAATLDAANAPVVGRVLGRAAVAASGGTRIALGSLSAAVPTTGGDLALAVTSVTGEQSALAFASAEAVDATARPVLTITFVQRGQCGTSALLVPACGAWFGSTVNTFGTETGPADALARLESELGRTLGVVHFFHRADEDWPTPTEVALTTASSTPRLLMENWKPEQGSSWAQVAAGAVDASIDMAAARIVSRLAGKPFFLTLHHEPEQELQGAGSGNTTADYVAMFRHVVQRLRADGVTNAVVVWDMTGFAGFGDQGVYPQLYPGDDVVDWIGYDPYSHRGTPLSTFGDNPGRTFPGFYTWATTSHPSKPLMLAEFGVEADTSQQRAAVFAGFADDARQLPAVKAYLYFDHAPDSTTHGIYDYSLEGDAVVLAAARAAFIDPYFLP